MSRSVFKGFFLTFFFIGMAFVTGWFQNANSTPIHMDELAWVNDAEVYEWRATKNWQFFSWSHTYTFQPWTSPDFRLFDQPHLVKYIYGFALASQNIKPWIDSSLKKKNYNIFIKQALSDKKFLYENENREVFGTQTIEAIILCRKISLFFGLAFFLLLFLFVSVRFSLFQSMVVSLLLMTNRIFFESFRVATADSISMFFILCSVIGMYYFFTVKKLDIKTQYALIGISSITSALAADSKVNGWLLVLLFAVFSVLNKVSVRNFFMWLILFLGTYMYLQPELWNNPFGGMYHFFSQRLTQQNIFLFNFGSLNFFEYHVWLMELLVASTVKYLWILKSLLVLISFVMLLKQYSYKERSFYKEKIPMLCIGLIIWFFLFFYARVGFERYGMWSLVILSLIFSKGLQIIFDKAYRYITTMH